MGGEEEMTTEQFEQIQMNQYKNQDPNQINIANNENLQ